MPRFPVHFGKRRSTADSYDHAPVAEPSFRVLERTDASHVKSFDGDKRSSVAARHSHAAKSAMSVDLTPMDDNIFADMKNNRGSGVSNNTAKSSLTDNSSRHSNASTAPSSTADPSPSDEARAHGRKQYDIPVPPIPKASPNNFLRAAGRTFSFGGSKKGSTPPSVPEESLQRPFTADVSSPEQSSPVGRARATTASTTSTATPPKLEEEFDLGGDFSKMLSSFDKRQSVMTLKDDAGGRQALGPRSLTGNRLNQPAPLNIDKSSRVEASPLSWNSHASGEGLLAASPGRISPMTNENVPPPVPKHGSVKSAAASPVQPSLPRKSPSYGHRNSNGEEEDASLLTDISAASKFLSTSHTQPQAVGRYRRTEDTLGPGFRSVSSESRLDRLDAKDDDNLFDSGLAASGRLANRFVAQRPSPPRNKVMTPAQFERYRQDKERRGSDSDEAKPSKDEDDEDEINYDDDEDEIEKSKQAAKQRRKQEAHMAVYRQQMMKVTGESATGHQSRPSISMSFSTPNLLNASGPSPPKSIGNSDGEGEEEDEEVPLAILAAHGFPNKNRPPAHLSTMMSNPNLKAAAQTQSYQRPGSVVGDASHAPPAAQAGAGGRLPVFARNLPQDPYVGAGLINHAPRESLSFSGGSQVPGVPPGGLVGVIASEERSRALRRGSPAIDSHKPMMSISSSTGFDPLAGIPSHMMYPNAQQSMSTTDQAQMQMNQQMTQFMHMQMQFMQMMANQGGGNRMSQVMPNGPMGMMGPGGMPGMGGPDTMRHSFMDNGSVYDMPIRPESHVRSMSMVQPSSASWVQPPPNPGYAPSIRVQGVNGYAPSIAPSERSNIGLPGRYRPVSQLPAAKPSMSPSSGSPVEQHGRKSSVSGGLGNAGWDQPRTKSPLQFAAAQASDEDDDDEGWAAMKQKRDKKRSLWKTKKSIGSDISAMIR